MFRKIGEVLLIIGQLPVMEGFDKLQQPVGHVVDQLISDFCLHLDHRVFVEAPPYGLGVIRLTSSLTFMLFIRQWYGCPA